VTNALASLAVTDVGTKKARVFVPGKVFQSSLILETKAKSLRAMLGY
jgi:hypothetical protein